MRVSTVGWFCRSLGVRSLAGGIGHNVGRHEPVRCPTVACAKTNRVPSAGERGLCRGLRRTANFWGVHIVHTLGFGWGRIGGGLGRIAEVFGSSQCLQGLESGSSPTSGTLNPSSEGFLL